MEKNKTDLSVALCGAGGKMGMRILRNLRLNNYETFAIEPGETGKQRLKDIEVEIHEKSVIPQCDIVVLAVPDALIGIISQEMVPLLAPDATLIILDPAAAFMNEVCMRDDCTFVAVHPCHPVLFYNYKSEEARQDVFGGVAAEQDIVMALLQGSEENFSQAEAISKDMFAPVLNAHRITVEQMAILEPAAAEVVIATCACIMKEALDETIARGVPEEAAKGFLMGHIQIPLSIIFKNSNPFSDAAVKAIEYGREKVIREDWKKVFEPEMIQEALQRMLHS